MNDLEVKIIQNPGSIDFNFQEIKDALALQMSAYTSLEITEDKQKEAKSDLATLRKIRKAVDDKRKEVKKSFMQPYTDFEVSVKDLLTVIDAPIEMIDGKLKEFDEKRKSEKIQHIRELYNDHIGDFKDYLPFESVFDNKWLNVSTTDRDVIFDLSECTTKVRSDIDVIKALRSEIEDDCLRAYRNAGNNLAAAITKNSDYISAKAKAEQRVIAEQREREEAERKAELEKQKELEKEIPVVAATQCQPSEPVDVWSDVDMETGEILPAFTFKVQGNENIQKVKEFLDFAEIPYIEV